MPITIKVNGLSLCHKGSGGTAHNTVPDVCKTPGNGVPVPYQNEAYSRDLIKGSTSTFADGGNTISVSSSQFAKSVFDETGSMGGVISGTHLAETDWISHSFNVFIEGRAACRLTDKLFMNHRNSSCLAGLRQNQVGKNRDTHLPSATYKDYNQARNAAVKWLKSRGFKAERATSGKFGGNAGKPIGMQSADGKIGFRVEFDKRHGAHINTWAAKEKNTFTFSGNESLVNKIAKSFIKERG